jgi:hypothetical protein
MRERARRIERNDPGVCAIRAQEHGVELVRTVPVRAVAAMSCDESEVFAARHARRRTRLCVSHALFALVRLSCG